MTIYRKAPNNGIIRHNHQADTLEGQIYLFEWLQKRYPNNLWFLFIDTTNDLNLAETEYFNLIPLY